MNPSEEKTELRTKILRKCEELGWQFQEPFITHLEGIVARRRQGCNPEQVKFWLVMATDEQLSEALDDTLTVLQLIES